MLRIGIYLGFGACNLVLILNTHQRIDFFGKSAPYYDIILDLLTFGQYAKFLKRGGEILAPQKGERILDLCSGTGRVASWMVQAVGDEGEVVGMDISKSMVEEAKRRYGGLKKVIFLNKDATKPWEYQNYFDGIFTSFAIHELPGKKRLGAVEHSYLALKERGRIVIADFNPQVSGIGETILLTFFKLFERGNLNFFSFDQNEILKKVGFKRIETFPVLASLLQITLAHK
jgi:demethylmenaquinone methyltransferase/2-methoxy-6-polyprenyl-1,4-benzoquinol methylase